MVLSIKYGGAWAVLPCSVLDPVNTNVQGGNDWLWISPQNPHSPEVHRFLGHPGDGPSPPASLAQTLPLLCLPVDLVGRNQPWPRDEKCVPECTHTCACKYTYLNTHLPTQRHIYIYMHTNSFRHTVHTHTPTPTHTLCA